MPEAKHDIGMIVTHEKVDLDACASVWAARRFMCKDPNSRFGFISAAFTPPSVVPDGLVFVDIDAGGHGLKGTRDADGTTHSCFALIVERFCEDSDKRALAPLIEFVDAQDISANAVRHLAPGLDRDVQNILLRTSIVEVLWGLKEIYEGQGDKDVVDQMFMIFEVLYVNGLQRLKAEADADRAELLGDGKVAIIRQGATPSVNAVLFDRGVAVIVYEDGNDLGVIRNPRVSWIRMDHEGLRAIVQAAGEAVGNGGDTWFAHPAGFLFCRGSGVAHAPSPSRVDLRALGDCALRLLKRR